MKREEWVDVGILRKCLVLHRANGMRMTALQDALVTKENDAPVTERCKAVDICAWAASIAVDGGQLATTTIPHTGSASVPGEEPTSSGRYDTLNVDVRWRSR